MWHMIKRDSDKGKLNLNIIVFVGDKNNRPLKHQDF